MRKYRLYFVSVLVFLFFAILVGRAFQLQVVPNPKARSLAKKQLSSRIFKHGRRGMILDRFGRELAISTDANSLFFDPSLLKTPKSICVEIKKLFSREEAQDLCSQLRADSKKRFHWLKRKIPSNELTREQLYPLLRFPEVGAISEFKRDYPLGNVASQVLGIVDVDGKGLEGLERSFEEHLAGGSIELHLAKDARGRKLFENREKIGLSPHDGKALWLSLDSRLQLMLENLLDQKAKDFEAKRVLAIVMEASSGELWALAQTPRPSFGKRSPRTWRKNFASTDLFEPGSVVKSFVVAKAFEDGVIDENESIDTGNGFLRIGRTTIGEADPDHRFKSLTPPEIIKYSSNVGTIQIARRLGFPRLFQFFEDLGFGAQTELPLPGEASGIFRKPGSHRPVDQATISYGQGIAITPIQLLSAYSVFAGEGVRVRPRLTLDPAALETKTPEKLLSKETLKKMRLVLESVTQEGGTGVHAAVDGISVGGKTGTALKPDPVKGGYRAGAYWASFVGFVPAERPRFLILVLVDEPQGKRKYASQNAAPLFADVVRSLERLGHLESEAPKEEPLLLGQGDEAERGFAQLDRAEVIGGSQVEQSQVKLEKKDFTGRPLREFLSYARQGNIEIEIEGSGFFVKEQKLLSSPGERFQKIRVELR